MSSIPNVLVTDAPFNAKCDGSTDDHVAIQNAINAVTAGGNGAISLPPSPFNFAGSTIQCNLGTTGLTVPINVSLVINGNNSLLAYTGSGRVISDDCSTCNSGSSLVLNDIYMTLTGAAGTTVAIYVNNINLTINYFDIEDAGVGYYYLQATNGSNVNEYGGYTDGLDSFTAGTNGGTSLYQFQVQHQPFFAGLPPVNTSATFIDSPGNPIIFDQDTWHWDNSDGASTGNANIELSDSCSGCNGGQVVSLNALQMHSGSSASEFNIKFDTGATEMVVGNENSWDGGVDTIFTGPMNGKLDVVEGTTTFQITQGVFTSGYSYNATSSPLPTCTSVLNTITANVTDATTPTFLGTYVGHGAVHSPVLGNGSAWVTY